MSSLPAPASVPVELEKHRPGLTGHCYRMLGSIVEADDAVQEAMLRAWRKWDQLQHDQAVRAWLYRIATNVCLDLLADRKRRGRPMDAPPGNIHGQLTQKPASEWLEPIPDVAFISEELDPQRRAILRQQTQLAFVAALQHLPPKQRAALLMTEVMDMSAAEVARALELTVPAVNSALQRARAKLAELDVTAPGGEDIDHDLLRRYVQAFEAFDVEALLQLFRHDVTYSMPPVELWLRGVDDVRRWLSQWPGNGCRGSRLVPTAASGLPAFGQYRPAEDGSFVPWALIVLELAEQRISGVNIFLDVETLFPRFTLPARLQA